jgi:hypothetical protein
VLATPVLRTRIARFLEQTLQVSRHTYRLVTSPLAQAFSRLVRKGQSQCAAGSLQVYTSFTPWICHGLLVKAFLHGQLLSAFCAARTHLAHPRTDAAGEQSLTSKPTGLWSLSADTLIRCACKGQSCMCRFLDQTLQVRQQPHTPVAPSAADVAAAPHTCGTISC